MATTKAPKNDEGIFPSILDQVKVREVVQNFGTKVLAALQSEDVAEIGRVRFQLDILVKDAQALRTVFDHSLIALKNMSADDAPIQNIETLVDRSARRGRKTKEVNPLEDF